MEKVKIFECGLLDTTESLEETANTWLENNPKVVITFRDFKLLTVMYDGRSCVYRAIILFYRAKE